MQTITSTPKTSPTGTQLVQITDATGNLTNVSTDSVNENLQRVGGTLITLGQKVMASSLPVVLASDQVPLSVTIGPSSANKTIQLLYETANSQPVNANEWQDALEYTVPNGYNLSVATFSGVSASAGDTIRAVDNTVLATYNSATNTFTDGLAIASPQFASRMYFHVQTAIGSGSNDTVTVTYVNQSGTAGRTASAVIPKSSLVGTRIEIPFQTGDFGVRDVTNVTHTATSQAGAWEVEGTYALAYLTLAVGNVQYDVVGNVNAIVVAAGQTITLQYKTGSVAAKSRRISLIGPLSAA